MGKETQPWVQVSTYLKNADGDVAVLEAKSGVYLGEKHIIMHHRKIQATIEMQQQNTPQEKLWYG